MKYSGIDLHSNNSVVVVSDEADRVLVRRRGLNDAAAILALLAGHREELVGVVVESTYNWYWLVDALQAAGYRVHLANTAAIKRYGGLKHSDDEDDAAYLAQLLRLEILPSGYICPPAARAVRDLALGPGVVRHELMGVQLERYRQQRDNRRTEHQERSPLLEPCLG